MSSTAAGSAALLILTQATSRALTFIGNQIVLRYSAPALLGIAVQLELVSVTILYFARESLRVALQRQRRTSGRADDKNGEESIESADLQGAVNTSYLAILLGLLIGTVSFGYYGFNAPLEVTTSPNFQVSYQCYIVATLAELLSEPFFIVIQQQSLFRARAAAETRAAVARCLTACAVAFYTHRTGQSPSTLPFAAGQLAYGLTLFTLYFAAAQRATRLVNVLLTPTTIPYTANTHLISRIPLSLLTLSLTLYAQSTFKLLLTQGDALLLSFLAPLASQGAFALVSNYGGLLARLIFQPVEESSRNTFGRLLSSANTNTTHPNTATPASNLHAALNHLATALKIYALASLPILVLAPPILPALTPLILAARWRSPSTTQLLQSYIYYLPLTAFNGILDAFVTSVATSRQLHLQSLGMVGFTAVYGVAAWSFLNKWDVGPQGLVWAGMLAMLGRVAWGAVFVWRWIGDVERRAILVGEDAAGKTKKTRTKNQDQHTPQSQISATTSWFYRAATPSPFSVVAAVGVWIALKLLLPPYGQVESLENVQQLGVVVLGALVLGTSLLLLEREFLRGLLRSATPRRVLVRLPAGVRAVLVGSDSGEASVGGVGVKTTKEKEKVKEL